MRIRRERPIQRRARRWIPFSEVGIRSQVSDAILKAERSLAVHRGLIVRECVRPEYIAGRGGTRILHTHKTDTKIR